jgi:hypothetical protein
MRKWICGLTLLATLQVTQLSICANDSVMGQAILSEYGRTGPFDGFDWERILRAQEEESIYDEPLATDRPDFTEASSVVGRGVLQLETGYTYAYDDEAGTRTRSHTAPEALFRYGISDNVEVRLVWNYLWTDSTTAGVTEREDGAEDLVMGFKFALTSQSGWVPESALILDMSSPTGGAGISNEHTEFGSNYLFGWDLPEDKSFAGSFGYSTGTQLTFLPPPSPPNVVGSTDRHGIFHASVTHGIPLSESWNAYFEYFGLYFHGLDGGRPENYFDTGVTHLFNNNVQFDARIGIGLNRSADDFFAGTGMSFRF